MNSFDKNNGSAIPALDEQPNINQYDEHDITSQSHIQNTQQTVATASTNKGNSLKKLGILAIMIAVGALTFSLINDAKVDISQDAITALQQGHANNLPTGTRLLAVDAVREPKDYTIYLKDQGIITEQQDNKSIEIFVWDYAAVDGDYVQLFYNGVAISDAFMINHTPRLFKLDLGIAMTNLLQVKGIKDGGGGITYAVLIKGNTGERSFYNAAPLNQVNTYTLNFQ